MLQIESFLRIDNTFITIKFFNGNLSDINYVEGAIEISCQGKKILTLEDWDLIDQLWGYFVTGLQKVSEGKKFETYFPDQPLKIAFEPDSNRQRVKIKVKEDKNFESFINYDEFMAVMADKGKFFFKRMIELSPSPKSYYKTCIEELEALEKAMGI